MPFIPNELDAFHPSQASPDSQHFESLRAGSKATGVVSGCLVSAQGTPDMTVAVASGVVSVEGAKAYVTAGNLTLTADGTDPRFYLITASSAGVKSAVAGTPAPEMDPPTEPGPAFPDPAGGVVLASVYVPAADTDIDANQIDDMRVFVNPPEPTTNYDLAKALDIPLVKERSQTVTLDSGELQIHDLQMAGGKLFGSTRTSPAKLIRFNNLEDLTDRTAITFASDGFHNGGEGLIYVPGNPGTGKLYVLFGNAARILVSEVDPVTLAVTDVINDTGRVAGSFGDLASDGTHLYVATYASPSKVVKYQLSDFAFVAEVTLTGLNSAHSMIYDGTDFYVGGASTPAWVAKVAPALTFSSVTFAAAGGISHPSLASVGDYVYVGLELAANYLWRLNKADLALEDLNFTSSLQKGNALLYDGQWLWIAHDTNPGTLTRLDPATGNTATLTFATGEDHAYAMASDGHRLFITFWDPNPAIVKRFVPPPLSTQVFSRVPSMPQGGSLSSSSPVGVSFIDHATRSAGTSEVALTSLGIAANMLNVNKRGVRFKARGRFAATTNTKRVKVRLGSTDLFDTGLFAFDGSMWTLEFELIRTGVGTQDWSAEFRSSDALLPLKIDFGTATADETIVNILATRAIGGAASDVQQETYISEMLN